MYNHLPGFLVLALVLACLAATAAGDCCPACGAWQGDCPIAGVIINTFTSEAQCTAASPGGCLYNPQGTWTAIYEPCAPSPCSFFQANEVDPITRTSLLAGRPPRLGTCVPGTAYDAAPDRTQGIYGAYATFVNQSYTFAAAARQAYDGNQLIVGPTHTPTSDVKVSGNTLFWTEVPETKWRLRSRNAAGYTEYTFSIDNRNSGVNYGASEEYIVTGTTNNWANGVDWSVYAFGQPNTLVSVMSLKQAGSSYISFNPVVRGRFAFVLDVDTMHSKGPDNQDTIYLHAWDVTNGNATHRVLNVNISHCLYPQQAKLKPETISDDDYDVFCQDDRNLDTCTFYYAASGTTDYVLCQMDMKGTTTPLFDKAHADYVLSADNPLFSPSGVIYAAGRSATKVSPGDTMVYLYASNGSSSSAKQAASYHWYNDMLAYDVAYCFAPAFPNLHLPSVPSRKTYVALIGRRMVYRVTPGFGTAAFFGFDFESGQVTPVNLPWGTPNTRCNYFTYGGTCDRCVEELLQGYTNVYALANGTLLFAFAQNDDGTMNYGVAQMESSFILAENPAFGCRKTGCTPAGGFCDHGQCYCLPGCSGVDCSQGKPFCGKKELDWCAS